MLKFQRDVHYSRGNKKLVRMFMCSRYVEEETRLRWKKYMATEGIGWSNVLGMVVWTK